MKVSRSVLSVFLLCGIPAAVSALPFDTMLARLEKALALLTTADAPTTYVISTTLEIADGGKKILQTTEIRERVTLMPDRPARRETLSRKTVGEATDANSGASRRLGAGGSSWNVVFPVGKDRPLFTFGAERKEGSLIAVDFAPARSASAADGLTKGTLAWDPVTELPSRLDAVPVRNPPFVSRLTFAFTFESAGGYSYPASVFFSGEGGFLFFKRRIQSTSKITEFSRKP